MGKLLQPRDPGFQGPRPIRSTAEHQRDRAAERGSLGHSGSQTWGHTRTLPGAFQNPDAQVSPSPGDPNAQEV